MSGHSKWSTIKRAKGVKDVARGKVFSKLTRAISLAAKSGGDLEANPKLRIAVEQARAVNMPKENIMRAIDKAVKQDVQLEEIVYEGFGPGGVAIIVEVATDKRNRTGQEIKNIFERSGGNLAGPGAVSFNFDPKGLIIVEKNDKPDEQVLALIDLGVEDVDEGTDVIEVYTSPSDVGSIKEKIDDKGYKIRSLEFIRRPKNYVFLEDRDVAKKAVLLLGDLEDQDDVQKVFTNADLPDDLAH